MTPPARTDLVSTRPSRELPSVIPVFPLNSVLLLPGGHQPLNIFEPRYRAMTEHALSNDRIIGMVHSDPGLGKITRSTQPKLLPLGCAGTITECERLPDGRFVLVLEGLCRFRIAQEEASDPGGFRRVTADWSAFTSDTHTTEDNAFAIDREALVSATEKILPHGTRLNRPAVKALDNADLLRALAMNTPLSVWDMQALLEANAGTPRAAALLAALECAQAIRNSASTSSYRH